MVVSINQPAYLPWLGYFERIARSDLHVVLDHVQFEKNSLTNRNKVRAADGWTWLTVPVRTSGRSGQMEIENLEIDNARSWRRKHWDTLRFNYSKTPFFSGYSDYWENLYERPWHRLLDLTSETLEWTLDALGVRTPCVRSSTLPPRSARADLVLDICRHVGAETYLSGPLGRDYLDPKPFDDAGISVEFHDHRPPSYDQAQEGFVPGLAAIDALFNLGPDAAALLA